MLDELILELERRHKFHSLVDYVIKTELTDWPGQRIKKGLIHALVAEKLGVMLSPKLRAVVNERMRVLGFESGYRRGYQYFMHVRLVSGQE